MESIIKDFGIQPLLLTAQVVNFLILLFLLKKFLYGPILKVLETRKKTIADSLKNAEEIEKRLTKTEEDYQKQIDKASVEAKKIVDDATQAANQIVSEARERASADMEDILQKGRDVITQERQKMQSEMRSELTGLVVATLQQVSGKVLNKKDQVDIIEKTVKQIS